MYHILTQSAAITLGILDAECNELPYDASYQQIVAAAESSHETYDAAVAAARATAQDRWIIDPSGDSQWVAGENSND